ncbi:MAG: hypothetical protein AAF127_13640 [Pseudomonadota bacterium]
MSPFEIGILALAFVGFVVPAWLAVLTYMKAASRPKEQEPNKRYFAYAELLKSLHAQMDLKTRTVRNGPLFAATVRELANYPEYRNLSVLFLEEITVTGTKKFDNVVRAELKTVEADLLEAENA